MNLAPLTPIATMTKAERMELAKVVRLRAKVAKDETTAEEKRILADFEAQLAAEYPEHHPAWEQITATAREAVAVADRQIAALCRQFNIPEEFRPGIRAYWHGRGENAWRERRSELRRVAQTEAAARSAAAKTAIDRQAAQMLEELVSAALSSDQAKDFLQRLPSVDTLMPRLEFTALEAIAAKNNRLIYGPIND